MRSRLADPELTLTLTWIWLGVLLGGLLAYGGYRWWRRRHPRKPPPSPHKYADELVQRLKANKPKKAKHPRRGKPRKRPPRQR